jgi:hypothetical protein
MPGCLRPACRGRRDRAQTRRRDLASVDEGRKLRMGKAVPARQEVARCGAQGREQGDARPEGCSACLQHQKPSGRRAPLGGTGRERLCPLCRRVEPAGSEEGAHGCRKRGATIKAARQGSHLGSCSSPRGHPCAKGEYCRFIQKSSCRSHQSSRGVSPW